MESPGPSLPTTPNFIFYARLGIGGMDFVINTNLPRPHIYDYDAMTASLLLILRSCTPRSNTTLDILHEQLLSCKGVITDSAICEDLKETIPPSGVARLRLKCPFIDRPCRTNLTCHVM